VASSDGRVFGIGLRVAKAVVIENGLDEDEVYHRRYSSRCEPVGNHDFKVLVPC
jgi:hypothetical protein